MMRLGIGCSGSNRKPVVIILNTRLDSDAHMRKPPSKELEQTCDGVVTR